MKTPTAYVAALLAVFALATAGAAGTRAEPATPEPTVAASRAKTAAAGSRLVLPFYVVDTTAGNGVTTLFAVRNELDQPIEVDVDYYRVNSPQAPQRSDRITLDAKQVETINIRLVADLQVDADGMARGYVVIEALTEGALIQGDYYRVTPNEDFATGFQLLNADPSSSHNDLCGLFSIRFLNGGGFDSGTSFIFFLETGEAPTPGAPILALTAYDQPGNLLLARNFFADEVAVEVTAEELLSPLSVADFGAFEFQFLDQKVGHVSAILSAQNRYSVGLDGACGDP